MNKAWTDGACRGGNPGRCSCSWALQVPSKLIWNSVYLGPELHTNNYAEYMGLVYLLEYLSYQNIENVTIYSDSMLVVNQVNQRWKINQEALGKMAAKCYALLVRGGHQLIHVKGHNGDKGNEFVDRLCNDCLDEAEAKTLGDRPNLLPHSREGLEKLD
jgi:ribonuclease HI